MCRGYLLTQVAGGIAADRLGGKVVLGLGVLWWSLATVLTPLAAQTSLPVLLAMRALMGVGEGVAMPAMNNLLSRWIPSQERSRSLAFVYSGEHLYSLCFNDFVFKIKFKHPLNTLIRQVFLCVPNIDKFRVDLTQ